MRGGRVGAGNMAENCAQVAAFTFNGGSRRLGIAVTLDRDARSCCIQSWSLQFGSTKYRRQQKVIN
jgi:hypothetical protein